MGNAQFVTTEKSEPAIIGVPMADGYGQVIQGHLESSNAVVTDELLKLMRAQQAYSVRLDYSSLPLRWKKI